MSLKNQALEERIENLRRYLGEIRETAPSGSKAASIAKTAIEQDDNWAKHRLGWLRALTEHSDAYNS